jgi:DNA-binding NtrC family response regulator
LKSNPTTSVLVVDDDQRYLQTLRNALDRRGINVTGCTDRYRAIELAADRRFQMIVCNYFMPMIDGKSLLKKIQKLRPDCRLILTSSYPIGTKQTNEGAIEFIDKSELAGFISRKVSSRRGVEEVTG